jgi:nucleotide-binding universal stress UspA family protein
MSGSSAHGVVIGIDPSDSAREALDWAAAEATLRGVPLRIAHAWSLTPHPLPRADGVDVPKEAIRESEDLLQRARSRVQEQHPELRVELEVLPEEATAGLIRLGEQAELLVVGARGLGRFSSLLIGSVSQSLVAHAACPVVVFRGGTPETAPKTAPATASATAAGTDVTIAPGAVVLGVAPGEDPAPVEFAFAEAARRAVPLLAVRSWQYPPSYYSGYLVIPPDNSAERDAEETEDLLGLIAPARRAHPEVRLFQQIQQSDPASALVDASADACLTVVGADRHRSRFALPIGRAAQQVLHHAPCPVAVVPYGRA